MNNENHMETVNMTKPYAQFRRGRGRGRPLFIPHGDGGVKAVNLAIKGDCKSVSFKKKRGVDFRGSISSHLTDQLIY